MADALEVIRLARQQGASKLHLASDAIPLMRGDGGRLRPVPGLKEPLDDKALAAVLALLTPPERWQSIESSGSAELTAEAPGTGPVRLSLMRGAGGWSIVVSYLSSNPAFPGPPGAAPA